MLQTYGTSQLLCQHMISTYNYLIPVLKLARMDSLCGLRSLLCIFSSHAILLDVYTQKSCGLCLYVWMMINELLDKAGGGGGGGGMTTAQGNNI